MTSNHSQALGSAAEKTRRLLTILVISLGIIPVGVAAFVGNSILITAVGSAAIGGLCALIARRDTAMANIAIAIGLVGQAMMFTAAFSGHPWQIDSHMAFFAVIAVTVLMVDARAVIVGSVVVVLHHVVLSIAMPALIYPSVDIVQNIARSLMHGAIVGFESAALIYTIHIRVQLNARMHDQNAALEASTITSEEARQNAEAAMVSARENEITAQEATQKANAALMQAKEAAEREQAQNLANQAAERDQYQEKQRQSKAQEAVVSALRNCLSQLSNGNYSARIHEQLEPEYAGLRDDFNSAMDNLETTFLAVLSDASLILHETTEIAMSSDLLATRTEQQADTLASVAASAKRLQSLVEVTAQNASNARRTVDDTKDNAHRNSEIVGNAVKAMEEIEVSSRQIEKITGLIDEIAFQTNLLALNAGVEAARAGDAGRGFAVVASEVRSLAQRSSEAASEINALIARSGSQIETGVGLVNETGTSIHSMLTAIDAISSLVAQIAMGSNEQSGDVTEVSEAISQLDDFTQQNTAMFEETSAATKSLTKRTEDLAARISQYVPRDHAQTSQSPQTRPSLATTGG